MEGVLAFHSYKTASVIQLINRRFVQCPIYKCIAHCSWKSDDNFPVYYDCWFLALFIIHKRRKSRDPSAVTTNLAPPPQTLVKGPLTGSENFYSPWSGAAPEYKRKWVLGWTIAATQYGMISPAGTMHTRW